MIVETLRDLGPWSWWIAGVVLLALELAIPGNVLVWFGVAAVLTGLLALFIDPGWQAELIVFVVLSVVLVVAGRQVFSREAAPGERPFLNDRAHRLVGNSYMLHKPIVDGHGVVRVDDANWRIVGPDMPSGTRVKVAGVDGTVLSVVKDE